MVTKSFSIQVVINPEQAPTYTTDWEGIEIKNCIIIVNGTQEGNPTVDIQGIDKDGKKYVMLVTGALMEGLSAAISGVKSRFKLENNPQVN
jgi:hypothetical protein